MLSSSISIPHPSAFREEPVFCTYFERISKSMPDEVFTVEFGNLNYIFSHAVRSLNLFPKCFKKVLDKASPENYHYDDHSIFYEFCWDRSGDISPSWLIYDLLIPYEYLMTTEERKLLVGNGKASIEMGIDSKKAEAGALLYELIGKREIICNCNEEYQLIDAKIFNLLDYIGFDFVNPQGVTPLLQAATTYITDVDFYEKMLERGIAINRKDAFGRCPLVETIKRHKNPIFKLFLENGADTNVLNADNNAICELAADLNFFEEDWHVFDSINDRSFLTALGKDGKSPFLLALEARNLGAIRYLGKGGYVRTDEMPQILEALSKIKNSEIRKEIVKMLRKVENNKRRTNPIV